MVEDSFLIRMNSSQAEHHAAGKSGLIQIAADRATHGRYTARFAKIGYEQRIFRDNTAECLKLSLDATVKKE